MRNGLLTFFLLFLTTNIGLAQIKIDKDSAIAAIEKRIRIPKIPDNSVSVVKFGAKGDGVFDCRKAFEKAIRHLSRKKGGQLVVPSGIYLLNGPVRLENNIHLHLEKGAVLRFNDRPESYLPVVETSWEGTMLYNYSPLVYANGKTNISITGEGVIDGEGHGEWATWKAKENEDKQLSRKMNHEQIPVKERTFGSGHFLRPQLVQFLNCENILVEGVKFEDAPFWCVHFLKSKNITVRNISYDAHNKNNDGIDLEYASDVLIENVQFNNADDNIVIKAGRDVEGRSNSHMPSENIIARNNFFKGLHAVVIGSEMSAGVRNVFIENNKASGYLKRGIYFKTNSDRGGYIKNIYISDLTLGETEDAIFMTANYHGEGSGEHPSKISDVTIKNVYCKSASNTGIVIEGFPTKKVENVVLDQITIEKATNGLTLTNTTNVSMNEVVIGEKAGTPSSVK